jgi:crotonobetainyl-CoA:carnitine CoA-transferase CaiB-like acyl-CoA transferase
MPAPLEHLRVVDVTDLRGALAGRLLADLGADVLKVEPPGGDPGRLRPPFAGGVAAADRSLPFLYRNANKRGAVIDLRDTRGRKRFAELLARADILVENLDAAARRAYGLEPAAVQARHPHLIHAAIADFGLSGPRADWRAEALPAFATSGALHASGFLDRPPCWLPGYVAHDCASLFAVGGALAALLVRARDGRGQTVEVSVQEAAINGLYPWAIVLPGYARLYPILPSSPPRNADGSYLVLPTADGHVRVLAGTLRQWKGFLELIGNPAALAGPEWEAPVMRLAAPDVIRQIATEALCQRPRAEVFADALRLRVPLSPVHTPDEFVSAEQTRVRRFFRATGFPHIGAAPFAPAPLNFSATPVVLRRPAPSPGEDDADGFPEWAAAQPGDGASPAGFAGLEGSTGPSAESGQTPQARRADLARQTSLASVAGSAGLATPAAPARPAPHGVPHGERGVVGADAAGLPLAGVRVVNLGVGAVAPEIGWMLAELGAEVVKVESRASLDFLRAVTIEPDSPNRAWTFNSESRGHKSVCLDLRTARGRELALGLCARADVVLENNRGGVVRRWGLDYEDVRRVRPDVIYLASQGFGRGGPLGEAQAYGPLNASFSGANWLWNHPDAPYPAGSSLNHPDHLAAKLAAVAVLAALEHRRRTGEGQLIEMAQTEAAAYVQGEVYLETPCAGRPPAQRGNAVAYAVPHGVYPCAPRANGEDRWCAIAVVGEDAWQRFAACLGESWTRKPALQTLAGRLVARGDIDARVAQWTGTRSAEDVAAALQAAGVSAMAVLSPDDLGADPHLAARRAIIEIEHPEVGLERHGANPIRLSRTALRPSGPAPLLGEHTGEVLTGVLDLSADEVARLVTAGVCR